MSEFNYFEEYNDYNNYPRNNEPIYPQFYDPYLEPNEYEKEKIKNRIEKIQQQNYYRELLDKQIEMQKEIKKQENENEQNINNYSNILNNNNKRLPSPFIINAGSEIIYGNNNINRGIPFENSKKNKMEEYRNELRMQIEENKKRREQEKELERLYDLKLEMDCQKYYEMKNRQEQRNYNYISNTDLDPNNTFFPIEPNFDFNNRQNNNLFNNNIEESNINIENSRTIEENEDNEINEENEYTEINEENEYTEINEENEVNEINESNQDINTLINKLPRNTLKDVNKLSNKECVICMDNYVKGDKIISLPCIHMFHENCIKSWLIKERKCPICKFKVEINE